MVAVTHQNTENHWTKKEYRSKRKIHKIKIRVMMITAKCVL